MSVTRRQLLASIGAAWLAEPWLSGPRPMAGRIVGNEHGRGHLLRRPGSARRGRPSRSLARLAPPSSRPALRADVVILGSGVSGLSAAWRLAPLGLDVLMLELREQPGGTSSWGDDGVVSYPWGAHYLPAPNPELRATLRLLAELGVVTGWDAAGRPQFVEEMLCHALEERLFYQGTWFEGLVPEPALSARERRDMGRLSELEHELTHAVGRDGRPAFQLPFEQSSRDPAFLALDRISMATWLDQQGLTSPFVRWYVRYAMLDDFGAELEEVSAWAGVHYFTARKLRTEQLQGSRFLVWPEGNGWLVRRLVERLDVRWLHGALACGLQPLGRGGVELWYLDLARSEQRRIEARAAVIATPAFVARRLLPPALVERSGERLRRRPAAPWLVANLHVRRPIEPNLPWDSVLHGARGLGYVDANHQLTRLGERRVLTYFRAFGDSDTAARRTELLGRGWHELASDVLLDLAPAHPELPSQTERLDVMVWGHGMPRPRPGFLGSSPFESEPRLERHIAWAHVDQTGFALFEEANQRGVRAAEAVASALGAAAGPSWL